MSMLSLPRGRPQCLSCMRRALGGFNEVWLSSNRPQIRGKKKLAKATTIKVRLLENVPRYGPKGKIVTISPGRMRNNFYPMAKAEYMTVAQLRAATTTTRGSAIGRDSTFMSRQDPLVSQKSEGIDPPFDILLVASKAVEIDLIKPEQAMKIISEMIPENIEFYRSPVDSTSSTPSRHSPSVPASSAISPAAQEAALSVRPQKIAIYGSVSTIDIAENLKAILAEDGMGSRVVLTSEDIVVVDQEDENYRVKHLGTFEIDIKVKGATTTVRRTITVKAQELA